MPARSSSTRSVTCRSRCRASSWLGSRPGRSSRSSTSPEPLPLHLQEPRGLAVPSDDGLLAGKERLVREFERQAVLRFLRESRGNVSAAAKKARITRRNFHRLLLKHQISPAEFRTETVKSHI